MSRGDASSNRTSPPLTRTTSSSVSPTSNGSPPVPLSISHIEAVIQMATASAPEGPIPGVDTRTQLFVGNLPYRVRWQDLKDLFRKAGTVLRADVSLGPDNRSRGYGTVLLATREDASRAVEMFNGYNWQTRILEVRLDRLPPPDLDISTLSPHPHSLAGSTATTPFPAGKPLSGYGGPSSLDRSLPLSSGLDDFQLQSSDRSRSLSNVMTRNLFVGNLPFHCQWQDLKDLFRQAGTIIRADVALGPDGRSRGFGTVSFANDIDAERAVSIFNGYDYNGRVLKVHYDKFAQSQMLQAQSHSPLLRFSTPNPLQVSQPQFLSNRLDSTGAGTGAGSYTFMPSSAPMSTSDRVLSLSRHESSSPLRLPAAFNPMYRDVYSISDTMNVNGIEDGSSAVPLIPVGLTSSPTHPLSKSASPSQVSSFAMSQQAKAFGDLEPSTSSFSQSHLSTSLSSSSLADIPPPSVPTARKPGPPPLPLSTKPSLSSVSIKAAAVGARNDDTLVSNLGTSVSPSSPLAVFRPANSEPSKSLPPPTTLMSTGRTSSTNSDLPPASASAPAPSHAPCEETARARTLSRTRQNSSHPHAHPGPITLPSPSLPSFPSTSQATMSPFQGLPPITPSMPTFTFVPQNATPPLNRHFLSPGVGLTPFSPSVPMSPGSYYHPDPRYHSMPWNPAPGAPIHPHSHPPHSPMYPIHGHSPLHSPSASAYFAAHPVMVQGPAGPPTDYFSVPPMPAATDGYFPPVPVSMDAEMGNNVIGSGSNPDSTINAQSSSSNESVSHSDNPLSNDAEDQRKSKNSSPGTSIWDSSPERLHSIAEELGRISIGVRASSNPNNPLAGAYGTERADQTTVPPVGPQRTHSDEAKKLPTTATLSKAQNETKNEHPVWGPGANTSSLPLHSPGERRASWTPEATKMVFRRELMGSATDSSS